MNAARVLREARRRAGLTQQQLAEKAGIPQSSVARIERGTVVPRVDTLEKLLNECGDALEALPRLGIGIDRTLIHEMLRLSPGDRVRYGAAASRNVQEFLDSIRRV